MRNKTFASLAVASALGLLTPAVQAFGLGKLELHSALNEPFKAEIAVTALRNDDAENLQVKLASNKEFEKAGLEHSIVLSQLEFEVVSKQGITYVSVSSDKPVKEPLLDFLVIATTGEGRLIREYTVLLDPPKNILAKKPTKKSATPQPTKTKTTATTKAKTTEYQYPQADQATYSSDQYGPTDRTDTLWNIAIKTRPEKSLSVNQMMMALLEANPTAFHRNNINGLKAGVTLDVPSVEAIKQLDKAAAISAVTEQNSLWKSRRATQVKSDAVAESEQAPAAETTMQSPAAVEQDDLTAEDMQDAGTSATTMGDTTARLKLVVPTDEASLNDDSISPQGDNQIDQLSEQLTFAQETIEAQAQENIDFKSRMDSMEEQLDTLRRLISLKDADLARLQSLLEQEQDVDGNAEAIVDEALALLNQTDNELELAAENGQETDDAVANTEDELATTEMESTESQEEVLTEEVDNTEQTEDEESEIASSFDNAIEQIDLSAMPSVDDVVSTTSELINVDEEEIQDFITQVKTYVDENKMTTMLGSLLILLALWLIIRRRNRPGVTWDEAVEKYDVNDDSSSVVPAADTNNQEEASLEENDVEDAEQPEEVNVKTVDDLINQADMFVGYADYTQAKSSLDQAMLIEPDNRAISLKMLFILFKQQNVDDFLTLVNQAGFDSSSLEWAEIVEWGRELAPENDLFKAEEKLQDENETELDDSLSESVTDEPLIENIEQESQESEHLEFNLEDFQTDDSDTVATDDEGTNNDELMSFDSSLELESNVENESDLESDSEFDAPLTLEIDNTQSSDDETLDEASISFDVEEETDDTLDIASLDLDEASSDSVTEHDEFADISENDLEAATTELANSADVEFDLGDFDEIDEAETKLDLASAYVDMGDPDGAKSILDEVLNEGSDEQKSRAQKLLDDLLK